MGRGTPKIKKPPDKLLFRQQSREEILMSDQWEKHQTSDSSRPTSTESPRRGRESFQNIGITPPSKSHKPNNSSEEILQQARKNLKPTSSTESSPTRLGMHQAHPPHSPGQSTTHGTETSDREELDEEYQTADVIITSKQHGGKFGRISAIRVSRAIRNLVSDYRFKIISDTTIKVTISASLLHNLVGINSFCGIDVDIFVPTNSGPREYTWGKFYSPALFYSSDEEILEELQEENENIILAKRLHKGSDKIPTRLLKIKFHSSRRPDYFYCL